MIPMMVEILEETPNHEDRVTIERVVNEFVTRLTGKQTIYQMMRLHDEILLRGGKAEAPMAYKTMYNQKINEHIKTRKSRLRGGRIKPSDMTVPGALAWLGIMKDRGIHCFLASGTDEEYVHEEAELLKISPYFEGIYGATGDLNSYSKRIVIKKIVSENKLTGPEFIVFGDGFVEIEEAKAVGGLAVGVASNEKTRRGVDEWKRERLITAGADLIIPDFNCHRELETLLFTSSAMH